MHSNRGITKIACVHILMYVYSNMYMYVRMLYISNVQGLPPHVYMNAHMQMHMFTHICTYTHTSNVSGKDVYKITIEICNVSSKDVYKITIEICNVSSDLGSH